MKTAAYLRTLHRGIPLLTRALAALAVALAASSCRLLVDQDRERVVHMMQTSDGSPADRRRIADEVRKLEHIRIVYRFAILTCVEAGDEPLADCARYGLR